MHAGEVAVSPDLARRLVAAQFPHWAGLPLRAVGVAGSDNAMIRLGDGLVLRFLRVAGAVPVLGGETQWLGWIAGRVPLAVPEVLATGAPGLGYPPGRCCAGCWAGMRWPGRWGQPAARALAGFVAALHGQEVPAAAPPKRGGLAARDGFLRQMAARMGDEADPGKVLCLWDAALTLPEWAGAPVAVHAHLLNLLVRDGALAGGSTGAASARGTRRWT